MSNLNKNDLSPAIVDLGIARKGKLNESLLRMFGGAVKGILRYMFADAELPPGIIRGTPSEIKSFADALNKEKQYMETYAELGLDNPQTYRDKYKLDQATSRFERQTGIKWPFK